MKLSEIRLSDEPVVWLTLVQTSIVLAVSFGLALAGPQTVAIMALAQAALAVVLRKRVTPSRKQP